MHRTREWGASDAGQSLLTQAGVSVQAAVQPGAATCRAPQMSAGSGSGGESVRASRPGRLTRVRLGWAGWAEPSVGRLGWAALGLGCMVLGPILAKIMAKMPFFSILFFSFNFFL